MLVRVRRILTPTFQHLQPTFYATRCLFTCGPGLPATRTLIHTPPLCRFSTMTDRCDDELAFTKDFGQPDPLPAEAVAHAIQVLEGGRLHRYQHAEPSVTSHVSQLEVEFANMMGFRYCAALNSCGSAMYLALKGLGVGPGDQVLVNAHTLTPVPSAVVHCGASPVFVECDDMCLIDLPHLEQQIKTHPQARVLLLSHMRSRICDLPAVAALCAEYGVALVEDCAHALGSTWEGRKVGTFGIAACFSAQTNKLLNAGEGGLLVTDDEVVAGRAILHSGSYGYYAAGHPLLPPAQLMARLHDLTPNFSLRMTDLTAALIRPQLRPAWLKDKVARLNANYEALASGIAGIRPSGAVEVPGRLASEGMVGSSLQFRLSAELFDGSACARMVTALNARGVRVAWFGRPAFLGFTSTYRHWRYCQHDKDATSSSSGAQEDGVVSLPQTHQMQALLCDVPLYHTCDWSVEDFAVVTRILQSVISQELSSDSRTSVRNS